ncbi:hypothetical protein GCM10023187_52870 [Nibrella viscosa]|uniref:Caspase family p20 domain-containing protein n=1 Tax=Nibrella viscosa TaxID=1084524 RepID=A0ABP8KYN9_9BACT
MLKTFTGHTGLVSSVTFSPDGTKLLSGSWDKTIKLWDVGTGRLLRTYADHSGWVSSVSFSPDGKKLVSGSWDSTLKLWDVDTGTLLKTFTGHSDEVRSVAFSPDGTKLLSGSWNSTLKLWDANTGILLKTITGHTEGILSVAFSPDGKKLLSGSADKTLRLWDASTGTLLKTFTGHESNVISVAFNPDGTKLLSGSSDVDGTLKLWDASTGILLKSLNHNSNVESVAFSPDGKKLLSGSFDKTLKLWDASTGTLLKTFAGFPDSPWTNSVVFNLDGTRLISCTGYESSFKVLDAKTGTLLKTFTGHSDEVRSAAFSPDGKTLLSGSDDRTLKLWNADTGTLLKTFTGHSGSVSSVAFSPDGKKLLSGSRDSTLKLWDANTGTLLKTFTGHSDEVRSVAFSPDGKRLLSGGRNNTLWLWDARTGTLLKTIHTTTIPVGLLFLPGGNQVLVITEANVLELRERATLELLATYENTAYYTDYNYQPPLTPDGQYEIYVYYQSAFLKKVPSTVNVATNSPVVVPQQVVAQPGPVPALHNRHALVIGNSTYKHGSSLENRPVNDASDMAARLKALGFQVNLVTDAGKAQVEQAIGQFSKAAQNADVALFFYAGHGVEAEGVNYLIPTDARLDDPEDARLQAISLDLVLSEMKRYRTKLNLVYLDACRNNPFRSWSRDGGGRGFKTVGQLAQSTKVYYATQPGEVAQNGNSRNGVFTSALLKHLQAGIEIEDLMRQVTVEVITNTRNNQQPWSAGTLLTKFVF